MILLLVRNFSTAYLVRLLRSYWVGLLLQNKQDVDISKPSLLPLNGGRVRLDLVKYIIPL